MSGADIEKTFREFANKNMPKRPGLVKNCILWLAQAYLTGETRKVKEATLKIAIEDFFKTVEGQVEQLPSSTPGVASTIAPTNTPLGQAQVSKGVKASPDTPISTRSREVSHSIPGVDDGLESEPDTGKGLTTPTKRESPLKLKRARDLLKSSREKGSSPSLPKAAQRPKEQITLLSSPLISTSKSPPESSSATADKVQAGLKKGQATQSAAKRSAEDGLPESPTKRVANAGRRGKGGGARGGKSNT